MSWIARLFKISRHPIQCPKCDESISRTAIYRDMALYCDHCGVWLATSEWLSDGSFNWGLVLERLADLLTEPTPEYTDRAQACLTAIQWSHSNEPATLMAGFSDRLRELSFEQIKNIYRDTFEGTPSCSLSLSKSMYTFQGDQESFVAQMSRELESKGVKIAPYSSDHLSLCLRAMSRRCAALGEDLAFVVLPAVSKVAAAMRGRNSVFENLLSTVEWVLTPR
jgi:nitrate reductase assembly molybdenum cofactor insertion protein NarJ